MSPGLVRQVGLEPRASGTLQLNNDTSSRSEWQRDEHGRFMQALELYGSRRTGDEWNHITAFVGSRTIQEVRRHGREYLQQLVQELPPSPERMDACRDVSRQNCQIPSDLQSVKGVPVTQVQNRNSTEHPNENGAKVWTFQDEKAFELALAGWAGCKSYPWAKIAAAVPGKSTKDVETRYEEMIREIAAIECEEIPDPGIGGRICTKSEGVKSTLGRRAVPPPPIETSVKLEKVPSEISRRNSFSMFSPTFLDLLAKEAESVDKSLSSSRGLNNIAASPLFSSSLIPSASRGFFSPGNKKSVSRGDKKNKTNVKSQGAIEGKSDDPRCTTPRIWNDFLADEFKFEDSFRVPSTNRKSQTASGLDENATSKASKSDTENDIAKVSAA